jgi:hypothetical protein
MGIPMRRDRRLFSELATFEEAFPQLDDALVEYREEGKGTTAAGRVTARDDSLEGLITCSNPTCRSGGFEVDRVFHEMIASGESRREGVLACPGVERQTVLATDEVQPIQEFYERMELEVEEHERKTGTPYAYDGSMTERLKKVTPGGSGRCSNTLHYRIELVYKASASG